MTLLNPGPGEIFIVRATSYHVLNPDQKVNNNIAVITTDAATTPELRIFAETYMNFLANVMTNQMVIERGIVSTFVPDSNPYDGIEFLTVEDSIPGTVPASNTLLLPLEVCLYLKKECTTGRNGKLFIRGALTENDVEFGQSLFSLANPAGITNRVADALTISGLSNHLFGQGVNVNVCIPPSNSNTTIVRFVDDITVGGVRFVNPNKRYYDR